MDPPGEQDLISNAEYEILTAAHEDLNGLWEAIWGLRSNVAPDASEPELRRLAEHVLRGFLERGWIELRRHRATTREDVPIDHGESLRLLADPANWEPPDVDSWYVGFLSTSRGDEAWYAHNRHSAS